MKTLKLIFLMVITLLITACVPSERSLSWVEQTRTRDHVLNAVATLVDANGSAFCSGVFWEGRVLTAHHCVRDKTEVRIATLQEHNPDDEVFIAWYWFVVIDKEEDQDLALLALKANEPIPMHTNLDVGLEPHVGQHVWAIGSPIGLSYSVSDGVVSHSRRTVLDRVWIQTSANVFYGNSGGPLLDENGNIIGVCSFLFHNQSHLNGFVHTDEVRRMIMRNR